MMPSSSSPTATISTRFSRTRSFTSPPTPAFRKPTEPDAEAPELDPEEQLAKVIREHDLNQLFVAFTATPSKATLDLFGKPFDSYTEAEAIAEGYIVDVAASIISYKTLYNLHCHFVPPGGEGDSMFLDKPVADRNAVQTVSRLNRCHEGKRDVVVVDFTNNAAAILKAFQKYRKGTPFEPEEPDKDLCSVTDRASGIILAHNHPEGGVEPSDADTDTTRRIKQAGEIVGIHLLDHIIFNLTTYFSFLEAGKL